MKTDRGISLIFKFLFLVLISCSTNKEVGRSTSSTDVTPVPVEVEEDAGFLGSGTAKVESEKNSNLKTVKGMLTMTDEFGQPQKIKNGLVVLQDEYYNEIARTRTDRYGSFEFNFDLPKGDYSIIYDNGTYHRVFTLSSSLHDFGVLNINPSFD